MKIGLFFGSFNPIHAGHTVIAGYMANFTDLNKVWLVVSPQNPLKEKQSLTNIYDRLEMARLAIGDNPKLSVSDIELKLPQPSYTIDTLIYLEEKYPGYEFALIMGTDTLQTLKRWKNYEVILERYDIYAYPRPQSDVKEFLSYPRVKLTEAPLMELSASFIRKAIKEKRDVKYFLNDKVLEFIESKGLYRK